MRDGLLRSTCVAAAVVVVVAAIVGGFSLAIAQTPAPPKDAEQQGQADKAMNRKSGQAGKEEPSSHAPTVKPQDDVVLVNGALAVPGAPENSDTVPAKFSAKNAADDELITVAHTFKHLPDEQRNAIVLALKDQSAKSTVNAEVGNVLPLAVELQFVPDELVAKVPQTRDYQYVLANNVILLIAPANRIVVAAISASQDATIGAGGRAR